MALKLNLSSRSDVDALPEAVRPLYVEKDGKFILDLEGEFVPKTELNDVKTKLSEFRTNNISLSQTLNDLNEKIKTFEGIDPEEARRLKAEKAELVKKSGGKSDGNMEELIRETVNAALKPTQDALQAEKTAREAAQRIANQSQMREKITATATKAGVRPSSLRHVLREAEDAFELKDGEVVARSGKLDPDDPLKPLTPDAWISGLRKSDDYLFEPSVGTGSENSGRPGAQGKRVLLNPTPEEKGKHMKDIASGAVVVEYTSR